MLKRVSSNWQSTVMVCAKCTKKVDGGFGEKGKTPLDKALRKMVGKGRKAPMGIVPVKCLGVCPRGAVTVVDSRTPREWMIVRAGTPVAQVAALLSEASGEAAGGGADQGDHVGDALGPVGT